MCSPYSMSLVQLFPTEPQGEIFVRLLPSFRMLFSLLPLEPCSCINSSDEPWELEEFLGHSYTQFHNINDDGYQPADMRLYEDRLWLNGCFGIQIPIGFVVTRLPT